MPSKVLTQALVDKINPPAAGRLDVYDKLLPGFMLRVTDKGAKSWSVTYRLANDPDRKNRRFTFGPLAMMPKVDAAREKAREALSKARAGVDPAAEAKAALRAPRPTTRTFETVAEEFIKRYVEKRNRPSTAAEVARTLRRDVIPEWRERDVASITKGDVNDLLDKIADRAPTHANRVRAFASKCFAWSATRGYLEANPVAGTERPTNEVSRDRVLGDEELRWLWRASGDEKLGKVFGGFVRVLLLTGVRRDEAANAQWPEIDLDKHTWTIPSERTKNGQPHAVPLSNAAAKVLRSLPRYKDEKGRECAYVFSHNGRSPISGFSSMKRTLDALMVAERNKEREKAGLPKTKAQLPAWRLHDARRSVASGLASLGVSPVVIARVLNHSSRSIMGITAIYNRFHYGPEVKAALDKWATHLEMLVKPPASNVVELKRRTRSK